MAKSLADVLHYLVNQASWFTEADKDAAHAAVEEYPWLSETSPPTTSVATVDGLEEEDTTPSVASPTSASPSPLTPTETPTPEESTSDASSSSDNSDEVTDPLSSDIADPGTGNTPDGAGAVASTITPPSDLAPGAGTANLQGGQSPHQSGSSTPLA